MNEGIGNKLTLEERLQGIEVEVARIRKRIEILPRHQEVSWETTREKVFEIVADAFRPLND